MPEAGELLLFGKAREKHGMKYEHVKDRVWLQDNPSDDPDVFVFLVRAPLTFAHSEVVVARCSDEVDGWVRAAKVVQTAILALRRLFRSDQFVRTDWRELCEYTETSGEYLKTLVLKASADEDGVYKVHLVPFFASHGAACKWRFNTRTGASRPLTKGEPSTGGLIGWLGEREDFTQVLEDGHQSKAEVATWSEGAFRLVDLANELRCHVQGGWNCAERE